jgi:hypothetical protein
MAWSQTTVLQDEQRALKRYGGPKADRSGATLLTLCRFKTQMQHVQNSEISVENKKKHCMF